MRPGFLLLFAAAALLSVGAGLIGVPSYANAGVTAAGVTAAVTLLNRHSTARTAGAALLSGLAAICAGWIIEHVFGAGYPAVRGWPHTTAYLAALPVAFGALAAFDNRRA